MSKYEKLLKLHKVVGEWIELDNRLREFNREVSKQDIDRFDDALAEMKKLHKEIKGE